MQERLKPRLSRRASGAQSRVHRLRELGRFGDAGAEGDAGGGCGRALLGPNGQVVHRRAGGLLGASTGDAAQCHVALRRVALYAGGRCCGRGVGAGERALYRWVGVKVDMEVVERYRVALDSLFSGEWGANVLSQIISRGYEQYPVLQCWLRLFIRVRTFGSDK